jgi:hypothetical protein
MGQIEPLAPGVCGHRLVGGRYDLFDSRWERWGKWISAGIAAISGVCALLPAIMGHAEHINKYEKLHFAYCELFELSKLTALDIRRSVLLTDKQLGAAVLLNDLSSRLGQIDDPDLKSSLLVKCEAKVRERFPKDMLWYPDQDAGQRTEAQGTTGATSGTGAA